MTRSKKKEAHRKAERTAVREHVDKPGGDFRSYAEIRKIFKELGCDGPSNLRRGKLLDRIVPLLKRRLRADAWELYNPLTGLRVA